MPNIGTCRKIHSVVTILLTSSPFFFFHLATLCSTRYTFLCEDHIRVRPKNGEERIASQVEYYFSDINLKYDKHLKQQLETDGSCRVSELIKFPALNSLTTVS